MKPERIQLKRTKGWRMPPNTVKVTRPGIFGNPFAVVSGTVSGNIDGQHVVNLPRYFVTGEYVNHFEAKPDAAALAVKMFKEWIDHPAQRKKRDLFIVGLRGKNLACWCKVGDPCHADALLELANK